MDTIFESVIRDVNKKINETKMIPLAITWYLDVSLV